MVEMDAVAANRRAWDVASRKYVQESDATLTAANEGTLVVLERELLGALVPGAVVLHLQSGNGTDDIDLCQLGATSVVGVDFSSVAAAAARDRARSLSMPINYLVGDALLVPLRDASVDLVYTGKGALMWLPDLVAWAANCFRVLRSNGHLFLFEAHPAATLWTRDEDQARLRSDRRYFGGTRQNDTFPKSAIERFSPGSGLEAVEWQWTVGDLVTALLAAGFVLRHLGEHPEPFWRPADAAAVAAWTGALPNSLSLIASKPAASELSLAMAR